MDCNDIVLPTCEVSMDPESAVELGRAWGIRHFEMKTLWEDRRVPDITDKQREQLKHIANDYGVDWVTISPGLFIGSEPTEEVARQEIDDKLPRSIELAQFLGATTMIVFSFRKREGVSEAWVVEKLAKVVERAAGSGLTLAIEPLSGNYCDSGRALRRVIEATGSDTLRVNWDPANVAQAGHRAYPDEYLQVRDLVSYVHLKNFSAQIGKSTLFDVGDIDLKAQLGALKRDGYNGYLAVETHTRWNHAVKGPVGATKEDYEILMKWLAEIG
jgi:sugar phosphate isomerase/epimerase